MTLTSLHQPPCQHSRRVLAAAEAVIQPFAPTLLIESYRDGLTARAKRDAVDATTQSRAHDDPFWLYHLGSTGFLTHVFGAASELSDARQIVPGKAVHIEGDDVITLACHVARSGETLASGIGYRYWAGLRAVLPMVNDPIDFLAARQAAIAQIMGNLVAAEELADDGEPDCRMYARFALHDLVAELSCVYDAIAAHDADSAILARIWREEAQQALARSEAD